jgi:hypothetical protein
MFIGLPGPSATTRIAPFAPHRRSSIHTVAMREIMPIVIDEAEAMPLQQADQP